jgi:hypothetical protein
MVRNGKSNYKAEIRRISLVTAIVIGIVCICSAFFALISKSTPYDLKHMLNLHFDITRPMLLSLIISGGLTLIIIQFFLTKITMRRILKFAEQ